MTWPRATLAAAVAAVTGYWLGHRAGRREPLSVRNGRLL